MQQVLLLPLNLQQVLLLLLKMQQVLLLSLNFQQVLLLPLNFPDLNNILNPMVKSNQHNHQVKLKLNSIQFNTMNT
jgi:accessory gene regulator protein AgrB